MYLSERVFIGAEFKVQLVNMIITDSCCGDC